MDEIRHAPNARKLLTPRGAFAALTWGDEDAPLVLALHGFPDEPSTFDQLAPLLTRQGYHVVAPYLRGYGPSVGVGPYGGPEIAKDAVGILEALGNRPALLLGHDFGAQAYFALFDLPERARVRLTGLVTLTLPHPGAVVKNLPHMPAQWRRSAYVGLFQLGGLADWLVRRDDFHKIEQLWRRWSPGYEPSRARMERVKAALSTSWPSPLRHYRAGHFGGGSARCIDVPWLHLMGADDGCTLPETRRGQGYFAGNTFEERVLDKAGHFLHLERPEACGELVERFAASARWAGAAAE